jgi:hypothetical protein
VTIRGGWAGRISALCGGVALCLAAAAAAQDPAPGTVGGPPTNPEFHEDPKPRSEVLVIGVGRTTIGRVEVVAYDSRYGLCVDLEFLDEGSGVGSCGSDPNAEGRPIAISGWGSSRSGRNRTTNIQGVLAPEVASVTVRARHKNGVRTPRPVVSQVDSEMASRLGQDEPFGHFVAALRGCIEIHRFRVAAFDASGARLGDDRIPRGGFGMCGRSDEPTVEGEIVEEKPPRGS